jgi:hypothetical protein
VLAGRPPGSSFLPHGTESEGNTMADKSPDAIALLKADHRAVEELFEKFEGAKSDDKTASLARQNLHGTRHPHDDRGRDSLPVAQGQDR